MEKFIKIILITASFAFISSGLFAQTAEKISLRQTTGEFKTKSLKLKAGKSYVFEVENDGVDHEVGFVIAPKGQTAQKNHITESYLAKTIKDGESSTSQAVTLEKGEYVYFCPLNPTPLYTLIVK